MKHIPCRERTEVDLARVEVATNAYATMRPKLRVSVPLTYEIAGELHRKHSSIVFQIFFWTLTRPASKLLLKAAI